MLEISKRFEYYGLVSLSRIAFYGAIISFLTYIYQKSIVRIQQKRVGPFGESDEIKGNHNISRKMIYT